MNDLMATFFTPAREEQAPWLVRAGTGALFVAGLIGWAYLFGWGSAPLDFHDWTGINIPRLAFLQNALHAGTWPLHMGNGAALHGVTDRFLTLPDVTTTPQSLLLLVMPVPAFVLIDVLINYAIGFAGLLALRRHFQWSLFTTSFVFTLFIFNGHIVAHYSVGHFTWGPYFLFTWILLRVFRFLDGDATWRSVAWFAATMFYMVLAGGQHHVTWVLLLLGLMLPFCVSRAWWLMAVAISSVMLSAVRLLPPALEISSFRNAGLMADVIGYPSFAHLFEALLTLRREVPAYSETLPGNIWFFDSSYYEFNVYLGVVGTMAVAYGVYQWLKESTPRYPQLIVPTLAIVLFSLGSVYRLVILTAIPMLSAERYSSRMFSLPLTVAIVMAGVALDRQLQRAVSAWQRVLWLIGLGVLALDAAANLRLWRIRVSSSLFGPVPADPASALVALRSDPAYVNVIAIGLGITFVTAAILLFLVRRERSQHTAA